MAQFKRSIRVRAIIEHDGKYLFVKHAPSSDYWALPGGHVEDGESIIDAMRREIVEELGIEPLLGKVLYINQFDNVGHESLELFFAVSNGDAFVNFDLDTTSHGRLELSEAAFIDPQQEYVLPEFLQNLTQDIAEGDWPKIIVHRDVDI